MLLLALLLSDTTRPVAIAHLALRYFRFASRMYGHDEPASRIAIVQRRPSEPVGDFGIVRFGLCVGRAKVERGKNVLLYI